MSRLVQLYLHDLSAVGGWDVGDDGLFTHNLLEGCWTELQRHPYLIHADGSLAGFAIVDQGSYLGEDEQVWDMAEFFVLRRWRRSGVGRAAAVQLFSRFPGRWEVRPFAGYPPALRFWESICAAAAPGQVETGSYRRSSGAECPILRLTIDRV